MENQREVSANEHTLDIRSGLATLHSTYGMTMNEFDYLDLAINELRDIKNFAITQYLAILTVDSEGFVDLPCNLHDIDALVTVRMGLKTYTDREKYEMSDVTTDDYYSAVAIMDNVGHGYFGLTEGRVGEGFIPYSLVGKRLKVSPELAEEKVALAFTGVGVDPEGYPKITRKQANAIASAAAYSILFKRVMIGDKNAAALLELQRQEKGRLKQAASIPEDISDNEINQVLDVQTSFNRKNYKRPTKFGR